MKPLQVAPRLDRLRARFDDAAVDALIVTYLPNVRYLTGFTGSAGVLAVTPAGALLTTDGRYRTQSAEQVEESGAVVDITIGALQVQRDAVHAFVGGASRVGLEADHVSWSDSRQWGDLVGEVFPTSGQVEGLREVKDEGEIDRMARAAAIADAALEEVLSMLSDGVSEADFALALDSAMRRNG
ncbi:MAG TPA: aminopeptidase P family N-terminal domain-containing protein, partial [Acidimicrobiales bacterium]|nr:aminopeptidase P family N-terminal domain-containing protein [Acidimicrobiales bacterium]